jgi:hypothetical protein
LFVCECAPNVVALSYSLDYFLYVSLCVSPTLCFPYNAELFLVCVLSYTLAFFLHEPRSSWLFLVSPWMLTYSYLSLCFSYTIANFLCSPRPWLFVVSPWPLTFSLSLSLLLFLSCSICASLIPRLFFLHLPQPCLFLVSPWPPTYSLFLLYAGWLSCVCPDPGLFVVSPWPPTYFLFLSSLV